MRITDPRAASNVARGASSVEIPQRDEAAVQRMLRVRAAALAREVPAADHAIVVFGCPARPDGTPSPSLERRLRSALAVAEANPDARLVLSGAAVRGRVTEADAMRRWLVSNGVAAHRITMEPSARFTLENAELSAALVRNMGASKVTLVTEDFHMPRSRALFIAALRAVGASAAVETARAPDVAPPSQDVERAKITRDRANQIYVHAT